MAKDKKPHLTKEIFFFCGHILFPFDTYRCSRNDAIGIQQACTQCCLHSIIRWQSILFILAKR